MTWSVENVRTRRASSRGGHGPHKAEGENCGLARKALCLRLADGDSSLSLLVVFVQVMGWYASTVKALQEERLLFAALVLVVDAVVTWVIIQKVKCK